MMTSVRRLQIIVDQKGDAQKGIKSLSGGLSSLISPATAAVAAVAAVSTVAVGVGSKLIGLASDAEEMQGKFDVVFGDSAVQAAKDLDEFGNAVGRNKFELMDMAAGLQDMLVPMGFARDEAAGLSVDMTELAVDVASFNNASDSDVQRDFASALTGSHETVKKYGIIINQATLDQELLNMGIDGGVKSATEAEKVQARYNIIMQATSDAQGDAARTSGSWANQMRALKAEFTEAATTIGSELLPLVTPLLHMLLEGAKTILPLLVKGFQFIIKTLREELGPVFQEIKADLMRIWETLGINTEGLDLLGMAFKALKVTLDIVVIAVRSVAAIIKSVADILSWVKHTTIEARDAWESFTHVVRSGANGIRSAIDRVVEGWERLKQKARDAINAIPSWLRPGSPTPFELGLRGIADAAREVGKRLPEGFGELSGTEMPGARRSGGNNYIINLTYAPAVSLGDQYEAETVLVPYIQKALGIA